MIALDFEKIVALESSFQWKSLFRNLVGLKFISNYLDETVTVNVSYKLNYWKAL